MIGLIDYDMGNLRSVHKALEFVGADVEVVSSSSDIQKADSIVLPGVGSFGDGMENLHSSGLTKSIIEAINENKPFLGICLGMQMLMESSEEAKGMKGLSVFKGSVIQFPKSSLKVPHIGWNSIETNGTGVLNGIKDDYFYFVHSYFVSPKENITIAKCNYIVDFAAAIGQGNVFATQFHPEKSQEKGLKILKNFVGVKK